MENTFGNRFEKMDTFLKPMALENRISVSEIYFALCSYGLTSEEKEANGLNYIRRIDID